MTLSAPIILLPTKGLDYTTDVEIQTLSGTTVSETKKITVNGSTYGVSYTTGDTIWAWTGTIVMGVNAISIIAEDNIGSPSLPATINITLVQDVSFITVAPPTGVKIKESQDQVEIVNVQNSEVETIGYNYYVSLISGGINGTYVKINPQMVTDFSSYQDVSEVLSSVVDTAGNIRVTTTTEEITRVFSYSQIFDKVAYTNLVATGQLPAATFSNDTPFFFVVSAVIYDSVLGQVTESAYSQELQGSPLTITTGIQDLPARTQNDIILTLSSEIMTANPGISLLPGTVVRDMMDPVSEEMSRVYIIQNFLSRALSVSALQDFDDSNHDGISDPVSSSIPKQTLKMALGLTSDLDVQIIIDSQFDKLAANVDVRRKSASAAIGSVTFYTTTPPIRDMIVNQYAIVSSQGNLDQGIPSQNYQVLQTKILSWINRDQFYNPQTNRYELLVDIQCTNNGSIGNTDSYTVTTISSGIDTNFQVENPNPISFGTDRESNYDLATRIELAMFADTGTKGGYTKTAIGVQGVRRVNVQDAGAPLMIRDYDPVKDEHVGGKVDVYIQGERTLQVTDQIAFSYESIGGVGALSQENFPVINAPAFEFQSQNSRVSAHTPIFEVTKVSNVTRANDYDLTGYQIIGDGDTIKLDETLTRNVAIGLASADLIRVDYKFRSSDTFILQNQPVTGIVSVVGQLSGTLTTDNYELVKLQDPLDEGSSTIATDGLRIKFANGLPRTEFQTITDESHVLILGTPEPMNFIGSDPTTLLIKNTAKTITYIENVDYRVIPGSSTVATQIEMIESGSISNGQTVLISYTCIENFVITYTTNGLLASVQAELDTMKHACADVIAKQAVENGIDFAFTVVPKATVTNTPLLTSKIRTAIANYVSQLSIGSSVTQSEIVHIIQSLPDVNYVVLPMSRMVKSDGSFIIRDDIGRTQFQIFNDGMARSYITTIPVLTYATIDKGGPENYFRGVFENNLPLVLQEDPLEVSGGAGRAYIQADGKLVVSTKDGQIPDIKDYQVAYFVYGEKGSKDINVASIEYLTVGNLTVSYDVPRG